MTDAISLSANKHRLELAACITLCAIIMTAATTAMTDYTGQDISGEYGVAVITRQEGKFP